MTTEESLPVCFVIQPFDKGRFDKRFEDAFKPALLLAGLQAYRVDQDPSTDVLIDNIESGIRRATVVLADVTTDNPNVWYELGFAYAAGKPVILVCCDERKGELPFDIRHRKVIHYKSESPSDFESLGVEVRMRAEVLLQSAMATQIDEGDPLALQDGLSQLEIHLLGLVAGKTAVPGETESIWSLQRDAKSSGLTDVAFGLAFRNLVSYGFVKIEEIDDRDGTYKSAYVTDAGWAWIKQHESLFRQTTEGRPNTMEDDDFDDDIPF